MQKEDTINVRVRKADYQYVSKLAKKQGRTFIGVVSELVNIHREIRTGIENW